MSLCDSIDTLAMAYLDDELAAEERRELELHLTECTGCKGHVDSERSELSMIRGRLAFEAAPDLLRAKVARALDAEDRVERRRWTRWMLPGSAIAAAAAAIAVFIGVRPVATPDVGAVAKDAVRQQTRAMPLEVQGASTDEWLHRHFEPTVDVPQFRATDARVVGARLTSIDGHDAALVPYQLDYGGSPILLTAVIMRDIREGELVAGDEVRIGDRVLHVVQYTGKTIVTYVDANHVGYMFMAPELSDNDLINLVGHTDLVGPP